MNVLYIFFIILISNLSFISCDNCFWNNCESCLYYDGDCTKCKSGYYINNVGACSQETSKFFPIDIIIIIVIVVVIVVLIIVCNCYFFLKKKEIREFQLIRRMCQIIIIQIITLIIIDTIIIIQNLII